MIRYFSVFASGITLGVLATLALVNSDTPDQENLLQEVSHAQVSINSDIAELDQYPISHEYEEDSIAENCIPKTFEISEKLSHEQVLKEAFPNEHTLEESASSYEDIALAAHQEEAIFLDIEQIELERSINDAEQTIVNQGKLSEEDTIYERIALEEMIEQESYDREYSDSYQYTSDELPE